jgi:hypothetical protein
MLIVLLIAVTAFVLNIPLGSLRSRYRRFSWRWYLYVHLSVPLIVAARIFTHTDAVFIIIFIAAAVAGQYAGGKLKFGQ